MPKPAMFNSVLAWGAPRCKSGEWRGIIAGLSGALAGLDPIGAPTFVRGRLVFWAMVVLSLTGAFAIVVGIHDVFFATELEVRAGASLIFAAGMFMAFTVRELRKGTARSYPWGFLACLLAALLYAFLFVAQVTSENGNWVLAVWAIGFVAGLSGARSLRQALPEAMRPLHLGQFRFVTSVVSLGALLSVVQFWYTTVYVPATAPASLSISAALSKIGERPGRRGRGDRLLLFGTATLRNTSGSRVNTVGSIYAAYGIRLRAQSAPIQQLTAEMNVASRLPGYPARRFANVRNRSLIEAGRLLPDGTFLHPGQSTTVPITLVVPELTFDIIDLYLYVGIARESLAIEEDSPIACGNSHGGPIVDSFPIVDHSILRYLVRGPRYVLVKYTPAPDSLDLELRITRSTCKEDTVKYNNQMRRIYGLEFDFARVGLPLAGPDDSDVPPPSAR